MMGEPWDVGGDLSLLRRFHDGDREVLAAVYRRYFADVDEAMGRILGTVDRENAVHDLFYSLLSQRKLREGFRGGSLGAWLAAVARNRTLALARRRGREAAVDPDAVQRLAGTEPCAPPEDDSLSRVIVERFLGECLEEHWHEFFRLRFLERLSQREVGRRLGAHRTTLAYQEMRIERKLRRFILTGGR